MKVDYDFIQGQIADLEFEFYKVPNRLIVACWVFTPDGFQVGYGQAGCVDPNEFDLNKGQNIAKKNAIKDAESNLWSFEGYLLKKAGKTSDKL